MLAVAMPHCGIADGYGASPLHALASEDSDHDTQEIRVTLATLLIARQCPLDVLDHDGSTALHHCVANNLLELADLLLKCGANPDALIPDSRVSPLMIATLERNLPMATLLLRYRADPHLRTREGSSPLSVWPKLGRHILHTARVLRF